MIPQRHYSTRSCDSALTFAPVWDPETGRLHAYSGRDLLRLRSMSEGSVGPSDNHYRRGLDYDHITFNDKGEPPFARFGARQPIHTPRNERFRFGRGGPFKSSRVPQSVPSSVSTSESVDADLVSEASPNSKVTFAFVWDPETGLTAFNHGKFSQLVPVKKHCRWPSDITAPTSSSPASASDHCTYGDIDDIKRGFYLRVLPEHHGSVIASSTFERSPLVRNFSCFDPLCRKLSFEPRHAFSQFESKVIDNQVVARSHFNITSFEDKDNDDHSDADHMPSRFSVSTTSTSGYVPINGAAIHPVPPITFLGVKLNRLRPKTAPDKVPDSQRERKMFHCLSFPRLFRKPWAKASDERWVWLEVQAIVTDRIIDE